MSLYTLNIPRMVTPGGLTAFKLELDNDRLYRSSKPSIEKFGEKSRGNGLMLLPRTLISFYWY